MHDLADWLMARRAHRLVERLAPYVPDSGPVLDVGAGTGHTARRLRELRPHQPVVEVDVADLRLRGPRPLLFTAPHLPLADRCMAASLLLHVLHYSPDPQRLLDDVTRVTDGPIVLVQSTYVNPMGWCVLRLNELAWGPGAYAAARLTRLVRPGPFSLGARRVYNRDQLVSVIRAMGLQPRHWQRRPWRGVPVISNLIVLDRQRVSSEAIRAHAPGRRAKWPDVGDKHAASDPIDHHPGA
jgi:SAM-dependent methyltransferase